jgi:hypothetical protein
LARILGRLARARRDHDYRAADDAVHALARVLSSVAARADLAGRVAMRLDLTGPRPDRFAAFAAVVPVQFDEALADLARREPALVDPLRAAAEDVRRIYGSVEGPDGRRVYPHGFALAQSLDLEVTARVLSAIRGQLAEGSPAVDAVAGLGDWTRAYAENVVRTNVTTAYSAGRLREARRLTGEGFEVGFEFQTAGDSDVRRGRKVDRGENHQAVDGIRAREDDPVWESFSPPLGYQCRCLLRPVVGGPWTPDALRVARARGARAAHGFGQRPDR